MIELGTFESRENKDIKTLSFKRIMKKGGFENERKN